MTAMRFKELDVVSLCHVHGEFGVGTVGTVLEVFTEPTPAYLVEFDDDNGVTLALVTVEDRDLQVVVSQGHS